MTEDPGLQFTHSFLSPISPPESVPGTATRLKVTLRSQEARHEVSVGQVERWLSGHAKSPREQALKGRLRSGPLLR